MPTITVPPADWISPAITADPSVWAGEPVAITLVGTDDLVWSPGQTYNQVVAANGTSLIYLVAMVGENAPPNRSVIDGVASADGFEVENPAVSPGTVTQVLTFIGSGTSLAMATHHTLDEPVVIPPGFPIVADVEWAGQVFGEDDEPPAPVLGDISVRHSGAWRSVTADKLWLRSGSDWLRGRLLFVRHNGAWVRIGDFQGVPEQVSSVGLSFDGDYTGGWVSWNRPTSLPTVVSYEVTVTHRTAAGVETEHTYAFPANPAGSVTVVTDGTKPGGSWRYQNRTGGRDAIWFPYTAYQEQLLVSIRTLSASGLISNPRRCDIIWGRARFNTSAWSSTVDQIVHASAGWSVDWESSHNTGLPAGDRSTANLVDDSRATGWVSEGVDITNSNLDPVSNYHKGFQGVNLVLPSSWRNFNGRRRIVGAGVDPGTRQNYRQRHTILFRQIAPNGYSTGIQGPNPPNTVSDLEVAGDLRSVSRSLWSGPMGNWFYWQNFGSHIAEVGVTSSFTFPSLPETGSGAVGPKVHSMVVCCGSRNTPTGTLQLGWQVFNARAAVLSRIRVSYQDLVVTTHPAIPNTFAIRTT